MKLKKIRSKIIKLIGRITGCYNYGKNNKVIVIKNGKPRKRIFMPKGLTVEFEGDNGTLTIEKPLRFDNTLIDFEGDDAEFQIKSSSNPVRSAKFYLNDNTKISIGKNSQMRASNLVVVANSFYKEPVIISIGDNVYIARDVLIRASDGHTIIDATTKEPLNPPANITIEDNVWIGSKAVILKGVHIPKGSIVGACSLVNKKFDEENVVIAGVPAKIIKHNTTWDKRGYGNYRRNEYDLKYNEV